MHDFGSQTVEHGKAAFELVHNISLQGEAMALRARYEAEVLRRPDCLPK
jgi:hypothetical protein